MLPGNGIELNHRGGPYGVLPVPASAWQRSLSEKPSNAATFSSESEAPTARDMTEPTKAMKKMDFTSRWVLVTGASSGLGAEMAEQLAAKHGAHLILVARREDRLQELARRIQEQHSVQIKVIAADLGHPGEAARVFEEATRDVPVYAAILNAGTTHFGHHDELEWEAFEQMLQLNVMSTSRLLTSFLPYLEKRQEHGGVLVVASLAGLNPVAYQSAYSGTKAFLVNFACSLHHEMKTRGVTVSTFAPGGIATEMTVGERFNDLRGWLVPVGPCANAAIQGFKQRRYLTIPGFVYRWGSAITRLVPQNFLVGQVAGKYRHSLKKNS